MLINLTNHPHSKWDEAQMTDLAQFGEITDYPFPIVDPHNSEQDIIDLADTIAGNIISKYGKDGVTIHIMGEQTLCYQLIRIFKESGIDCIASTTERIVSTDENGNKVSTFSYVRFRYY